MALDCYNQAIILAPCDTSTGHGEDLAIAAANRSAVMYRLQKYGFCLKDCELAERSGYPKHLKYKIFQRHANCLSETFKLNEADAMFKKAMDALNDSRLNKAQAEKLKKEIKTSWDESKTKKDLEKVVNEFLKNPQQLIPDELKIESLAVQGSHSHPALSDKVRIVYNKFEGRHAIATKTIKPGEVLGVEEPVVYSLYSERFLSNCSRCFKAVVVPVPCFGCSAILFCSMNCRDEAWNRFHKFECMEMDSVSSIYQNIFLVYRLICQKPMEYYRNHEADFLNPNQEHGAEVKPNNLTQFGRGLEFDTDPSDSESESDGSESEDSGDDEESESSDDEETDVKPEIIYSSDDYLNVFNLEGHDSEQNADDQLALATSSAFLLHFLKKSNYFPVPASKQDISEDELLIARILYRFLQVSQYNTHQISQMDHWDKNTGLTIRPIGFSINPTLALFNHSCTPNTIRCNVGTKTILISTQTIHAGAEITDSYSTLYQDQPRNERFNHLMSFYKFECRCVACLNDWPVFEGLRKTVAKPGMAEKVPDVKKMYAVLVKLSQQDLQSGYFDRIVEMWSKFYQTCAEAIEPPHKTFLHIASQIHDCFWLKHGNRVPKLNVPVFKDHVKDSKVPKEEKP